MSDDESSTSDHAMPSRGVIPSRKNRGWEGEQMELAHARASESKKGSTTAVDLSQFRNEEVGKGYQAKFVVRQRQAEDDVNPVVVKDMTEKKVEKKSSSRKDKRKRSSGDEEDRDKSNKATEESNRIDKYLKSEGLRRFRRELEKFLE